MNAPLPITLLLLGAAAWLPAQTTVYRNEPGSLLHLVGDAEGAGPGLPNEITVVLPPPGEEPSAAEDQPADISSDDEAASEDPAPEAPESGDEDIPTEGDAGTSAEVVIPADDEPEAPKPGISVRVERLNSGSAEIDPAQVKLLAPFPAKLLARPPAGWRIESSENAPPINREVELSPGKRITLNVRPHLLVAEADGSNVFQIPEPGYDAALGYRQNATAAAILSTSIRQLDEDSRQLGNVIEQLQQLLVSLPQPINTPEPEQTSKPSRKR
jgi:hypothetical protein